MGGITSPDDRATVICMLTPRFVENPFGTTHVEQGRAEPVGISTLIRIRTPCVVRALVSVQERRGACEGRGRTASNIVTVDFSVHGPGKLSVLNGMAGKMPTKILTVPRGTRGKDRIEGARSSF